MYILSTTGCFFIFQSQMILRSFFFLSCTYIFQKECSGILLEWQIKILRGHTDSWYSFTLIRQGPPCGLFGISHWLNYYRWLDCGIQQCCHSIFVLPIPSMYQVLYVSLCLLFILFEKLQSSGFTVYENKTL